MSLKAKVISGTKWVVFANIFRQVLSLVSLTVYARLLSPDDFGIFAVLMIFVGFLEMFSDMGTSAVIIQKKDPSHELLSSIFYFNLMVGVGLFFVLLLISYPVASFFSMPEISILLPLLSINFIITSFGIVQKANYEKYLDFKHITIFQTVSAVGSLAVGISAAFYGLGVYSLVLQTLTLSLILIVLIWKYSKWRPLVHFSWSDIMSIWKYTMNLSMFNFVNYFTGNADNFLIGKFLGSYSLGIYSLAYKIMLYPILNVSQVLLRILFPAFAKIQNDKNKFRQMYLRIIFAIALISFPTMIGLIVTAETLVPVVFGDKWHGLDIIIMILAPVGMLRSIVTTTGSVFMAVGATDKLFKIGTISAVVTVTFFAIGIPFGVEGVALSFLISNLLLLYPVLKISWELIELSVKRGLLELFPVFIISSIMGVLVYGIGKGCDMLYITSIFKLIIMIISGIGIYYVLITHRYGNLRMIISELKK
ncbi:MOP flippase family protein [Sulfurovum sp. XTW-4]|uniref:MOP flippase family protein n=1 Tax=Sulfurovum xiamenensis TaxID=3019066 RepID=A0ABT7QTK7_9BACT|nr:MOP flippase family protein [Sulfurovum xiamenensis]MDM5264399.1 MOP flippase family protein [Sulfurovum xiamenensis]